MTMKTLLAELRAAREARGLTLEDIGRQTLINVRFLKALEAGDTTILPQTYVRAFLRAYATSVGMDPVYAMQRLDGMPPRTPAQEAQATATPASVPTLSSVEMVVPPPVEQPAAAKPPPPIQSVPPHQTPVPARAAAPDHTAAGPASAPVPAPVPTPDPTPVPVSTPIEVQTPPSDLLVTPGTSESEVAPPFWSKPWVRSAGTTLVVVLGIATIAYFARQPGTPPQEIPFGTVLQENTARLTPPDTTRGTVLPQAVSPRDSLVLRATTTDSVWVQIARDALPPTEHLFPPGASRTWRARDRFTLSLGNAGGVSFRMNNRDLGTFGKTGAVLRNIELTRETLTSPVKREAQP